MILLLGYLEGIISRRVFLLWLRYQMEGISSDKVLSRVTGNCIFDSKGQAELFKMRHYSFLLIRFSFVSL